MRRNMLSRGLLVLLAVVAAVPGAGHAAVQDVVRVTTEDEAVRNHYYPTLVADPGSPGTLVLLDVKRPAAGMAVQNGSCLIYVSRDSGTTWGAPVPLPVPEGAACRRQPAPELSVGSGGIYAAYYATAPAPGSIRIVRVDVTDTGVAFTAPVSPPASPDEQLLGAGRAIPFAMDLLADRASNNVYVAWTSGPRRLIVWVSRSLDGGASFGQPVATTLNPGSFATGYYSQAYSISLAAAANRLYVAAGYGGCAHGEAAQAGGCWHLRTILSVSEDLGASFALGRPIAEKAQYDTGTSDAWLRPPSLLVDPSNANTMYMTYDSQDFGLGYNSYFIRSTDAGATWSAPLRLGDDTEDAGFTHERPALAIAPNGRIDVLWYDGRNDPTSVQACKPFVAGEPPTCTSGRDVYLSSSMDGGLSFGPNIRVSPTTFSGASRQINRGPGGGSSATDVAIGAIGVVSTASGLSVVWEQSSTVRLDDKTFVNWDLYSARVTL